MPDSDVLPEDDLTIPDDADLWRRLHPAWFVADPSTGVRHLTTQAFQNYPGTVSMSIILASEVSGPEEVLRHHPGYGIGSFKARLAREVEQRIVRVPTSEEAAHAHVIGKKSPSVRKHLRDGTIVLFEPER